MKQSGKTYHKHVCRSLTFDYIISCLLYTSVRPFLVETQALVSTAAYGTPQRSATGFDQRKMCIRDSNNKADSNRVCLYDVLGNKQYDANSEKISIVTALDCLLYTSGEVYRVMLQVEL